MVLSSNLIVYLIIIKLVIEKCQKFIPINIMSIKNNFIVTLTVRDSVGWRAGRLLSLIGLKMF